MLLTQKHWLHFIYKHSRRPTEICCTWCWKNECIHKISFKNKHLPTETSHVEAPALVGAKVCQWVQADELYLSARQLAAGNLSKKNVSANACWEHKCRGSFSWKGRRDKKTRWRHLYIVTEPLDFFTRTFHWEWLLLNGQINPSRPWTCAEKFCSFIHLLNECSGLVWVYHSDVSLGLVFIVSFSASLVDLITLTVYLFSISLILCTCSLWHDDGTRDGKTICRLSGVGQCQCHFNISIFALPLVYPKSLLTLHSLSCVHTDTHTHTHTQGSPQYFV